MGLFSRKKRLSKEEKQTLEKAREELKKIKENRDDFDVPKKIHDNASEKTQEMQIDKQKQNEDLAKLDQREEEKILASKGKIYEDANQTGMCCALDCDVSESVLNGKECKFCNRFCCIEHLLCHKHDCVKDRHIKFVRKAWCLRYISASITYYSIVSSAYVKAVFSKPSLIEISGDQRLEHISEKGCDSNQVWLEGIDQ